MECKEHPERSGWRTNQSCLLASSSFKAKLFSLIAHPLTLSYIQVGPTHLSTGESEGTSLRGVGKRSEDQKGEVREDIAIHNTLKINSK